MSELTTLDLAAFQRVSITPEILKRAGVVRVTSLEASAEFGIDLGGDNGIVFPYFSPPNGKPGHRVSARARHDHPPLDESGRPQKYRSPHGDNRHAYLPPCLNQKWIEDPSTPVVFVEAEKSALAILRFAEAHDYPMIPVALGGCWSWRGKIGKTLSPEGERIDEKGPLPDIAIARGRKALVCFDKNVATKAEVYRAREKFVEALREMNADVYVMTIPSTSGAINGPDDLLGSEDGDRKFFALLEAKEHRGKSGSNSTRAKVWQDTREFIEIEFPRREPLATIEGHTTSVFTKQSINEVFGWRGTGKSMLALSLAGAFSVGGTFLNWRISRPVRVLYVDGELPNAQIQERIRLLHPKDAHIKLITLDDQPNGIPSLATEAGQEWLTREIASDDEVLILDSVASLAPFATNDEENWLPFSMWLTRLRSRGLCIIRLMQAGRTGGQRGHSRAEDPLDVQIKLKAATDEEVDHLSNVELTYEKFRAVREGVRALTIECSKQGVWSFRLIEADKLRILEEFLCRYPKASLRQIERGCPELGDHSTIARLLKKLDKQREGAR